MSVKKMCRIMCSIAILVLVGIIGEGLCVNAAGITYKLSNYGISDSRIQGHKLVVEEEDEVIEANESLLWLIRPESKSNEVWYLIGHQGVIQFWNMVPGDTPPKIKQISVDDYYLDENRENSPAMYTVINPLTGKYDVINGKTDEYLEISADQEITRVEENQAVQTAVYKAYKNGNYAVLDEGGKKVSEYIYKSVSGYHSINAADAKRENDTWDVWLADGTSAGPYADISAVSPNYYMVKKNDYGKWALLSLKTGKLETDYEYDDFYHEGGGYFGSISADQNDVVLLQKICENSGKESYYSSVLFYDDGTGHKPYITDFSQKYGVDASGFLQNNWGNVSYRKITEGAIGILAYNSMAPRRSRTIGDMTHNSVVPAFRGFVDYKGNALFDYESTTYDGAYWGTCIGGHVLLQTLDSFYSEEQEIQLLNSKGECIYKFAGETGVHYDTKFIVQNGYAFFKTKQGLSIIDLSAGKEVLCLPDTGDGIPAVTDYEADFNIVSIQQKNDVGIFSTDTAKFSGFIFDWHEVEDGYSKNGKTLFVIEDSEKCEIWDENFNILAKGNVFLNSAMKIISYNKNEQVLVYDAYGNVEKSYDYDGFSLYTSGSREGKYHFLKNNPLKCSFETDLNYSYMDIGGNIIDARYYRAFAFNSGLASVMTDFRTGGIIDKNGKRLVYGDFIISYWNGEKVENSKLILEGDDGAYYFYDFSSWSPDSPEGPIKIIETSPANQEDDVRIIDSDISFKFDRNISFFTGTGMIRIKEYDTDKEVLAYNMIKGSGMGQVLYKNSSRTDEIILENALTALEEGVKYYVLIEDKCIADKMQSIEEVWFDGYSNKEDYTFTVGVSSSAFNDMACVAACELSDKYEGYSEKETVKEYLASNRFKDKQIWKNSPASYGKLFRSTIQNYSIIKQQSSTGSSPGILALKDESRKKIIIVFQDLYEKGIMYDFNEKLFGKILNTAYKEYKGIIEDYKGYDIMLTGNRFGGVEAAYISTLENEKAILFNGISNLGVDVALKSGAVMVKRYNGIDRLPIMSYYHDNDILVYLTLSKNVYPNAEVKQNTAGSGWDITDLYCYSGNFHMQAQKDSYYPNDINARTIRSNADCVKLLVSVAKALAGDMIKVMKLKTDFEKATVLTQGTSRADRDQYFKVLNKPQVIYTGGVFSTGTDVYTGRERCNTFVHSGGDAVLNGKTGKDIYIIHNEPGTVTINDPRDGTIDQAAAETLASEMFKEINIGSYVSILEFVVDCTTTRNDLIILSGVPVKQDMVAEEADYYRIDCPNQLVVKVRKRAGGAPIKVKGEGATEIYLYSDKQGKTARSDDNEYEYHPLTTVKSNQFNLTLYDVQGGVLESLAVNGENIFGDYIWLLCQNEESEMYISTDVARVKVEGNQLNQISLYFNESEEYMTAREEDLTSSIMIDYVNSKILYEDMNTEVPVIVEDVTIMNSTLAAIKLQIPETLVYEEGETLDLSDMIVYACYSDGFVEEVEDYQVSSCDMTVGNHTIEISYQGMTTNFEVEYFEQGTLVTHIKLPDEIVLKLGQCEPVTATVYPQLMHDAQLIYWSDDEEIVIARNGFLYAIEEGETYITVRDMYTGISDECKVVVGRGSNTDDGGDDNGNNNSSDSNKKYTVKFDSRGGSAVSSQTVIAGGRARYVVSTRQGYKFIGWYLADKKYNFSTAINKNITLIAGWQEVKVDKIVIKGVSNKIAKGKKVALKAEITPIDALSKAVVWSSSNRKIAKVNTKGIVTLAKKTKAKQVVITARAKDGSGVIGRYKIKVMKGVVKKIELSAAKTVKAGKSIKIKAKISATKGANKRLKWLSSNDNYATINSKGEVKTKKAGKGKTVKITAKATDGSNKKASIKLKIK